MTSHFNIKMGWLILMILMISPTVYAEQIITITDADNTLNMIVQTAPTKTIENAYPGMTLEFSPIILKNESGSTITAKLTADEHMIGKLMLADRFGKVIPETFAVPPSSTYQVRVTGTINESLGNELQGQTIQLPITLNFTETATDKPADGKLPQTSEAVVFSRVALLIGVLLLISVFNHQSKRKSYSS